MQDIWENMKRLNIRIIGIEDREEIQTNGIDSLDNKIVTESFPNIEKERVIQVQKAYRTSSHQDQKETPCRHIIIKALNIQNKERIMKASRENTSHI
jgi:hypothetical protein